MEQTTTTESATPRGSRFARAGGWFVRGVFSLGIAILFILLLRAISTQIQPPPDPRFPLSYPVTNTKERCEVEGGTWVEGEPVRGSIRPAPIAPEGQAPQAFCQGPLRFEVERQEQQRKADRVEFFVYVIGGTLALVGGVPLVRMTPIAPGFLLGGVIALLFGARQLWEFGGNLARLVTVIVLLVLAVVAGGYFFRDKKN